MSNKIDGLGQQPVRVTGSGRSENVRQTSDDSASRALSADERVTLTDSARQLQRLAEAVAQSPVVDTAKVATLREAVDRGEYQVDARRVADRMIDLERELVGR